MSPSTRLSRFNIASLALGLAFLYLPIVILVIYSFNASRLVTVWGGWSLRWYHEFFHDRAMLEFSSLTSLCPKASVPTITQLCILQHASGMGKLRIVTLLLLQSRTRTASLTTCRPVWALEEP